MIGKRSVHSAEIRSNIKLLHEHETEPKTIDNDICKAYGDNEVSFRLVRNWIAEFKCGVDTIRDTPISDKKFQH